MGGLGGGGGGGKSAVARPFCPSFFLQCVNCLPKRRILLAAIRWLSWLTSEKSCDGCNQAAGMNPILTNKEAEGR